MLLPSHDMFVNNFLAEFGRIHAIGTTLYGSPKLLDAPFMFSGGRHVRRGWRVLFALVPGRFGGVH